MAQRNIRLLEIYLDDHWAGAGAGERLAHRLARNNSRTEWAEPLSRLADQVAEDERTLGDIREVFDFDGGKVKRNAAIAAERIGRLKTNGRLLTYSPLSRLLECEALEAGISSKRRLWGALEVAKGDIPELTPFDFPRLMARAEEQLELLRSFHGYAAQMALGAGSGRNP